MERDEKVEKKDSSERNSGEGRRDDDVADDILLPQNLGFEPPLLGFKLDYEAVSRALINKNYSRHLTSTSAPPPENQEPRRDTSTDAAFKNLDQQTLDGGSAAPLENQEDRREIERYGDGGEKEAAELLPRRRDTEEWWDVMSLEAEFNKPYLQLDGPLPTQFDPHILEDFPRLGPYSDQENLGIGDTAMTAAPTTTTAASNLPLPPPPLQNQTTVSTLLKLQAALFDFGILQKHIKANDPFQLMTETATALASLENRYCCMGGCSLFEVKSNTAMGGWKEAFEQCCNEERRRVDKVTTECRARKNVRMTRAEVAAMRARYVVVTIMVSVQGEHELPIINSWGDMETALDKLASIPSDSANDTKVLWSPEVNLGTLSDTELLESYPSMKLFDQHRSFGALGS